MQFERQLAEVGGSTMLVFPVDLCKYLNLNPRDFVVIQLEKGKHGEYVSVWKKEQGK